MAALKSVSSDTVRNCWIACKILTLHQMQDLETGERHNSRSKVTATAATAGVSTQDIEDLSSMLAKLGRSLSRDAHGCVHMIEAADLIDMELEREVFDPPTT